MKGKNPISIILLLSIFISFHTYAQNYVSPTGSTLIGRSPGVKSKLISENGSTKTYALIFAAGDEVLSGLKEFALKYDIKSAYFTAIGDASSTKFGWYDKVKKMFKVTELKEPAEITSLIGDIAIYNNEPVVHCHINLAVKDGTVHGGHLLEAFISPTLEVILTVEPVPLYEKLALEFDALVIDPELK